MTSMHLFANDGSSNSNSVEALLDDERKRAHQVFYAATNALVVLQAAGNKCENHRSFLEGKGLTMRAAIIYSEPATVARFGEG